MNKKPVSFETMRSMAQRWVNKDAGGRGVFIMTVSRGRNGGASVNYAPLGEAPPD